MIDSCAIVNNCMTTVIYVIADDGYFFLGGYVFDIGSLEFERGFEG